MQAIDTWIETLNQYSYEQICTQPLVDSWSLGQVCMHLLGDTEFYIEQALICSHNNDNANESATAAGQTMLDNNSFPNEKLQNPANAFMPQPASKEQLIKDMLQLKAALTNASELASQTSCKGKTKHPGLGYFNAAEWIQFADMHFRHHLRQKKKIEDLLFNK
ncbi:MAG: DinB family protein [Chitinophagaceae bacterium]